MFATLRLSLLLLGLCGALLLAPTLAMAQAQPAQLAISPVPAGEHGYFELTLEPGASQELTVELGNYGASATEASTYAANVYSMVNGGMGISLAGESASGTTTWLDYPTEQLSIEGRKAVRRTFTVTVPPATPPGEYLTSLVIESKPMAIGGGSSTMVSQVVRQAIAVSIAVPGPRFSELTIGSVSHRIVAGKSVLSAELRNTGNVRVRPDGAFVLRDASGAEITRYDLRLESIYAGTSTWAEVPLAGELPLGGYSASIELSDPNAGLAPVAAERELTVVPPTPEPQAPAPSDPNAGPRGPAAIHLPTPAADTPAPDAPAQAAPTTSLAVPDLIWPLVVFGVLLAALMPTLLRRRR